DRDVVDVDLVLADEVEKEVERSLELGEADPRRVLGEDGLETRGRGGRLVGQRGRSLSRWDSGSSSTIVLLPWWLVPIPARAASPSSGCPTRRPGAPRTGAG